MLRVEKMRNDILVARWINHNNSSYVFTDNILINIYIIQCILLSLSVFLLNDNVFYYFSWMYQWMKVCFIITFTNCKILNWIKRKLWLIWLNLVFLLVEDYKLQSHFNAFIRCLLMQNTNLQKNLNRCKNACVFGTRNVHFWLMQFDVIAYNETVNR